MNQACDSTFASHSDPPSLPVLGAVPRWDQRDNIQVAPINWSYSTTTLLFPLHHHESSIQIWTIDAIHRFHEPPLDHHSTHINPACSPIFPKFFEVFSGFPLFSHVFPPFSRCVSRVKAPGGRFLRQVAAGPPGAAPVTGAAAGVEGAGWRGRRLGI